MLLEPIMKGLIEWIYEMVVDVMEYAAKELVGVMSMDMTYFEQTAPVIKDVTNIITALGWGLLIANMVFQSAKSMMYGIGFEGEDPKALFCRTFVFSFLLLASKQICNAAMGITGKVIELLQLPSVLEFSIPDESLFSISSGAKWLIVIVVGFVLIFQYIKLLFEIGERYVVTSVLTFFAPLAFAMGGSKNTNDIFKGWCRMYGSMMVMMIMNIVFLKLILSAMGNVTSGSVLIWLVFVVALTRVARKIDSHIGKIGLNPAQTGNGAGSRLPGMITMVAVRTMASAIGKNISSNRDSVRNSNGGHKTSYNRYSRNTSTKNSTNTQTNAPINTPINTSANTAKHTSSDNTNSSKTVANTLSGGSVMSKQSVRQNQGRTKNGYRGMDKHGIPYLAVDERYERFPNGNPNVHNGANKENTSHTNSIGSTTSKSTNRPPIPRNPIVKENAVNNVSQAGGSDRTMISQNSGNTFNNLENRTSNTSNNASNIHTDNVTGNKTINTENRINHEYKNGRYNPAAVNKKRSITTYHKQTAIKKPDTSTEINRRKKQGGKNGGGKK